MDNIGTDYKTFMAPVRASLGRPSSVATPPTPPAVDESIARLADASVDVVHLFCRRAQEVGMTIHKVRQAQTVGRVMSLLADLAARTVVVGISDHGDRRALGQALAAAAIDDIDWQYDGGVDSQFDVQVGITDVHAALAESGTLVCCSDDAHSRCLSLVPPIHVALVRRRDILPDMIDYWRRLATVPHGNMPTSINFITGPSKTADIEGELVTGVHGPEQVHIVVAEDG